MCGLTAFCRIRSYIATTKAHGVGVLVARRDAFLDHPWAIPHHGLIIKPPPFDP
jgi:hypothetical protein